MFIKICLLIYISLSTFIDVPLYNCFQKLRIILVDIPDIGDFKKFSSRIGVAKLFKIPRLKISSHDLIYLSFYRVGCNLLETN